MRNVSLPIDDDTIRSLNVGDPVSLTGVMMTGRDTVHKWMFDTFIHQKRSPEGDDQEVYEAIQPILAGSAIYHCGPVIAEPEPGQYEFVAAGPTTSTREEPYQGDVMRHFNIKAVIGKGGMGLNTLAACQEVPGVYLHAIGGAASLIAQSVRRVIDVYKLEFGVPEAMWVIEVEGFPAVVTMDAHGVSLHEEIRSQSADVFDQLVPR